MTKNIQRVALSAVGNRSLKSKVSEPSDPISRTPMRVKIVDIEPYDKNPRTVKNDSYDEIKESIREKGLEQPFTITRRPGDHTYTTRAGGNTRLAILKELYAETKSDEFLFADVYFEPFTKEQDLLISHLTENDLRGNLTLLDRAKGVIQARDLIEKELDRKLSLRELSEQLKQNGYSLNHVAISALIYALEELYPVLPELLEDGAGKPVVERVRKVEGQLKDVWKQLEQPEEDFKTVFNEALKEAYAHSDRGIDTDEIFRAFEAEAALSTGIDINSIRVKIAQLLATKPPAPKEPDIDITEKSNPSEQIVTDSTTELTEEEISNDEPEITEELETPYQEGEPQNEEKNKELVQKPIKQKKEDVLSDAAEKILNENPDESIEDDDLYHLREIALKQAVLVAEECGIEDLVIKLNRGFGWALADMPQEIHFTNCGIDDSKPEFKRIWEIWFSLYQLCGATLNNKKTHYTKLIVHENDLKALVEERFDEISDLGQYSSTISLNYSLPITASDVLLNKVNQLQVITRKIMSNGDSQQINIWEESHG
ncbi:ParB family protein [Thiomicrorhabdus indica]|uniref:ParB family protein n=1 Tax=Thiomicrorhabdus indica TaxID=2267253 RepID=UPI00102DF2B8|nr:ParB family protein [Thiomicrorhabdus indica]